jgi:phosphotransferase system IIB component
LEHFQALSEEVQKMYGDKNQKLNVAKKCMTHLLQGVNEPGKVNHNGIKANWRAMGGIAQENENLYEIA